MTFTLDDYDRNAVMPLDRLSVDAQQRIAEAVAQASPPPKFLDLGMAQIPSRAWFEWYWQRGRKPAQYRPKIPSHVRRAVIERDGSTCGICGGDVDASDLQLDHIVPFVHGGPDTVENLRVAHAVCNQRRGAPIHA